MKDLFSSQARQYSQFRPQYPKELFSFLASLCPEKALAWDCATGNGQAASGLAEHFDHVVATDVSEKQLSEATSNPKIYYRVANEENSGLDNASADLVTVAQAFHWVNHFQFYKEARRVAKPKVGVLALWGYGLPQVAPDVDRAVMYFYKDVIGKYWEPERRWVEDGYESLQFPFEAIKTPEFKMTAKWTFDHLVGYLSTWSAYQTALKVEAKDPLIEVRKRLKEAWGDSSKTKDITWTIFSKIGRLIEP